MTVTCPRCQKTFDPPPEQGDAWQWCPHCHAFNPTALVRKEARANMLLMVPGVLLLLTGAVAGTVGTFFCFLGVGFSRHSQILTVIWALGSIAFFAVGAKLMRVASKGKTAGSLWRSGGVFLLILVLAICGWVFVFATCLQ